MNFLPWGPVGTMGTIVCGVCHDCGIFGLPAETGVMHGGIGENRKKGVVQSVVGHTPM